MKPLEQHQIEIEHNKRSRAGKPLIRRIYGEFYDQIVGEMNRDARGVILEIGSGSGELKERVPEAICSDLFPNPWLDLVADAYRLPFAEGSISNLVLLDVFHHLARPVAFLNEAQRVLSSKGRLILFEPYISWVGRIVYGAFHHEPVGLRESIDFSSQAPAEQVYYAAQGNATRIFFGQGPQLPVGLNVLKQSAFAHFRYLLSGGLSKPALYPEFSYAFWKGLDRCLSGMPQVFGARCLVVLARN